MELKEAVNRVRYELYKAEGFADEDLRLEAPEPNTRDYARYVDRLGELAQKRTPVTATEWRERLEAALQVFACAVPDMRDGMFTAPVSAMIGNPGAVIERMAECFFGNPMLFERLRGKIRENAGRQNNRRPSQSTDPASFFAGTPLRWLFEADIPVGFPDDRRFEGQWVVARRGAGKTNLFSRQILRDFDAVARGEACVIVIDVTGSARGQLVSNVIRHKRFAPGGDLSGKLLYIDPTDRDFIPINLMSLRADASDASAVSTATAAFLSIMGGLMGQPLTDFQAPVFRAVVQLAMAMPNPTLATLREVIRPRSDAYKPYLPKLRPELREYFEHGYNFERVVTSRSEILNRLFSLSIDPLFARLFTHNETRLDFTVEMNRPQVIVINCDRNHLKHLTRLFGRFYFALITAAAEARGRVPRSRRLPTYIYFDEASEVIGDDPNAAFMMNKLRQMNVGLIAGMQDTSQAAGEARRAYAGSLIKFANCEEESARDLAPDMQCDFPFLMNHPRGRFAYFLTGEMVAPIPVKVPRVVNERGWISEPTMSDREFEEVMATIRHRYYVPERHHQPVEDEQADEQPETDADQQPRRDNQQQQPGNHRRRRRYREDE